MIRRPPRSTLFPSTPLFRSSGRHPEFAPLMRLTNSDVIELIAAQRPAWYQAGRWAAMSSITSELVSRISGANSGCRPEDRKSGVEGKRVDLGGRRIIKKKRITDSGSRRCRQHETV